MKWTIIYKRTWSWKKTRKYYGRYYFCIFHTKFTKQYYILCTFFLLLKKFEHEKDINASAVTSYVGLIAGWTDIKGMNLKM
jgi:hypothetical protein